jgi:class 3 adenylate cyclase
LVRTFLLADIRGYTRFTREHGDEAASELARRLAGLVASTVPEFGGELLEVRGDETLCVFSSARQALRAAVELQRRLRAPEDGEPFPVGVGMGLDAGEAVPTDGGYRGAALNMAGRLVAIAGPGEIRATERLVELTGQIDGLRWGEAKRVRLKGLDRPERVVSVEPVEPLPPPPSPAVSSRPRRRDRRIAGAALAVAIIVAVLVVVLVESGGKTKAAAVATPRRSVAVIDIARGQVTKDVPLSATPESMVTGGGTVWVGSADNNVMPINETTYRAGSPMGLCCNPDYLAFGQRALWAFDDGSAHLVEIDPRQGVVAQRRLWRCRRGPLTQNLGCSGGGVVVVGDEVWVGRANGIFFDVHAGSLVRLRATDLSQIGSIPDIVVGLLATDGSQVWSFGNQAVEADAVQIAPPQVIYHQPLPGEETTPSSASRGGLAMGLGNTWVGAPRGNLYRLRTDGTFDKWNVGGGITAVATSNNAVWVARSNSVVEQVSPTNGNVIHTYRLGHTDPIALAVTGGRVWVALA